MGSQNLVDVAIDRRPITPAWNNGMKDDRIKFEV